MLNNMLTSIGTLTFGQSLVLSGIGMLVVLMELAILAVMIIILSKVLGAVLGDKKPAAPAAAAPAPAPEMPLAPVPTDPPPKVITLEEVRAVLAERSHDGYTDQVRGLLQKYGAEKLSGVDPKHYAALLKDAEVLGHAT